MVLDIKGAEKLLLIGYIYAEIIPKLNKKGK